MKKKALYIFGNFVFSSVVVYILLRKIALHDVAQLLSQVYLGMFVLAFVSYFCVNILRAYRLYYIMETKNVFFAFLNVCLLHNFFNNIMPAKLGELSFPYLSKKKIYISYRESLSSLFLSRMMDMILMAFFFLTGLIWFSFSLDIHYQFLVVIPVIIMLLLILGIFLPDKIIGTMSRVVSWLSTVKRSQTLERIGVKIAQAAEKLRYYRSNRLRLRMWLISLGVYVCSFCCYYILFKHVYVGANFKMATLVIPFGLFVAGFPLGIAGIGTVEGGWIGILSFAGSDIEQAISTAFVFHFTQICFYTVLGISSAILLMVLKKPAKVRMNPSEEREQ